MNEPRKPEKPKTIGQDFPERRWLIAFALACWGLSIVRIAMDKLSLINIGD